MTRSSNIRVSVNFTQPAVFAGEDIECIITFTNHAASSSQREDRPVPATRRISDAALRKTQNLRQKQMQQSSRNGISSRAGSTPNAPRPIQDFEASATEENRSHTRSISIISLQSDVTGLDEDIKAAHNGPDLQRYMPNHSRASSTQIQSQGLQSAGKGASRNKRASLPASRKDVGSVGPRGYVKEDEEFGHMQAKLNGAALPAFKFPATPLARYTELEAPEEQAGVQSPSQTENVSRRHSPSSRDGMPDSLNPITRLLSGSSINGGTPRSSIDLYSGSNHSDETLASEYPTQQNIRQPARGSAFRQASKLEDVAEHIGPEHLMMGYAQVAGSFTLDASLVNQNPFEEVKRRSVVSGQGAGGVIGLERKKRDSGLLSSFGWSNIGDSIGELLGSGDMSSIREMRTKASSKVIPLLSTPHSILFVDLKLSPGESQKYSYRLKLPKGLPPTHRGRAMKVTYLLQVGIQRPGSRIEQRVKTVEIPFRIFGTVNARGDILSHDLLTPHVFLRDLAHTSSMSSSKLPAQQSVSDLPSFMAYVDTLLSTNTTTAGLLSPTVPNTPHMRRHSSMSEVTTSKEAINLAVLRSHQAQQSNLSTRFTISRSSRPVAVLMMPRSAYRLGETIHLIIDFSTSQPDASLPQSTTNQVPIPVYAVLVTLESHETIDQSIAMRSPQSIYRYTRKVHAQGAENALFARRLCFALAVPPSATPEFSTSGVSLQWRIRVEFMTPIIRAPRPSTTQQDDDVIAEEEQGENDEETKIVGEEWHANDTPELLEVVASDERGDVLQGIEQMYVDTFEVAVPLRIYGAVVGGGGGDCDVAGLAV